MSDVVRKALALLFAVGSMIVFSGLLVSGPAEAQTHSASRAFSSPYVAPDGTLEVTVTVSGYGVFGLVVEALPDGFSYQGSGQPDRAVTVEGQTVSFILLGIDKFTCTVAAPETEGQHSFSGIIRNFEKVEQPVGGADTITVGPPPTPEPSPTATRRPTPDGYAGAHADAGTDTHGNSASDAYGYACA